MTAQSRDWVAYENSRYWLLHSTANVSAIFEELGIQPKNFSAACYRGYEAEYAISQGRFWLTKLDVGSELFIDEFPPLAGVYPTPEPHTRYFGADAHYSLVYRVTYALEFDSSITMRYYGNAERDDQLSDTYSEVLKIKIENGYVQAVKDITDIYMKLFIEIESIKLEGREHYARSGDMADWQSYRADELKALQIELKALTESELLD